MAKKLTLNEKKLLNEHVTGETKRCLSILNNLWQSRNDPNKSYPELYEIYKQSVADMIKGSPYIEFHPELLKRIPE